MSIELMTQVWRRAPYQGTELLVLLACADAASDEGVFWHGVPKLAAKARLSERRLREYLAVFVANGVLMKRPRPGRSNVWQLIVSPDWNPVETTAATNTHEPAPVDLAEVAEDVTAHERAQQVRTPAESRTPPRQPLRDASGVQRPEPTPLRKPAPTPAETRTPTPARSRTNPCEVPQATPARSRTQNHLLTVNEPSGGIVNAREEITTQLRASLDPQKHKRRELWDNVKRVLTGDGTTSKGMREMWLDPCTLYEPTSRNFLLVAITKEQQRQVDLRWRTAIRLELSKMHRADCTLALDYGAPPNAHAPHRSVSA